MSQLHEILKTAVQLKASDIHINVGAPPLFRVHTVVSPSDFPIVTQEGAMRLAPQLRGLDLPCIPALEGINRSPRLGARHHLALAGCAPR